MTSLPRRLPWACVPVVAVFLCLSLPGRSEDAAKSILFKNVRVFDGTTMLAATDVLIRDGKISGMGAGLAAPEGAEVVDGAGKTLLPGLIDAHTHVQSEAMLEQALVLGVTTELDMMCPASAAAAFRKKLADGEGAGLADFRSAGNPATCKGGHGTEYGFPIPTLEKPEEADSFVEARFTEGSDYLKIIVEDGRAYGIHFASLAPGTVEACIQAAHKRGRIAVVHIGTQADARSVLGFGADGLAHLFLDSEPQPDFGTFAAGHRAFVIPTLSVLSSVSGASLGAALAQDTRLAPYLTDQDAAALRRSFPAKAGSTLKYGHAEAAVRLLKAAGVPILAGTDAPNPGTVHGASLHGELELLVKAGLTPAEALASATSLPAAKFGLLDRGRIAAGLRADLVLLQGDPSADIAATRAIVSVWKQGRPVDRAAYRKVVENEKIAAENLRHSPPPEGSESGIVSDFDDGETPTSRFGSGWSISTDQMMGGRSTSQLKVVAGGAAGTKGCLQVSGNVAPDQPRAWAGAMFSPGKFPMSPVNLSAKKQIAFWAKGDGREYRVMVFTQSRGYMPSMKSFTPTGEWKRFAFPLADFDGLDGRDMMGVFLGAGTPAGEFSLLIDDVRVE